MKKTICFVLFSLSCFFVSANTLQNNNAIDTIQQQIEPDVEKTASTTDNTGVVNSLTLAVNAINNIHAWSAAMIAVLTLIVAISGFIGYFRIRSVLKSNVAQVQKKINEINEKEQEFNNCIAQTKAQEIYIFKTNQCFYDALDKIANLISKKTEGKKILKEMLHNYQITSLYSSSVVHDKFAVLAYFQENGTLEDIEHLEHVAANDSKEEYKAWAREIIGIIRYRNAQ
ncbi:MAG: hypothetical protein LBB62_02330 [Proteiniphilum sp.]|jgi:hypothetical protein|nr:hypothetical protein [Proteiniphilum sp.]